MSGFVPSRHNPFGFVEKPATDNDPQICHRELERLRHALPLIADGGRLQQCAEIALKRHSVQFLGENRIEL